MRNLASTVFLAVLGLAGTALAAQPRPPVLLDEAGAPLLTGYGTDSSFGFQGTRCEVSQLADSGAGSLRSCLDQHVDGTPMHVTFAVGGEIELQNDLVIRKSHLTIDGSTAPYPGVTIKTGLANVIVNAFSDGTGAHDLLIQYLRFRGDWDRVSAGGDGAHAVLAFDCENRTGNLASMNLVLDHLTLTDANDSAGDFWGNCRGVTVQYSFIAQNYHPMSIAHSGGTLLRDKFSIHHNVFYGNEERSPQIRGNVMDLEYVNNINADWGLYGMRLVDREGVRPSRVNLIGNRWMDFNSTYSQRNPILSQALVFENVTPGACFGQNNVFPAQESDRCTGAAEYPRVDDTAPPPRHDAAGLVDSLIGSITQPGVGTRFPTDEETAWLQDIVSHYQ